jgi:hypothetical protein
MVNADTSRVQTQGSGRSLPAEGAHLPAHGGVLLLEQRAQLLVQVSGLLWQLRVPQPHARPGLVDEIDGLREMSTSRGSSAHDCCTQLVPV